MFIVWGLCCLLMSMVSVRAAEQGRKDVWIVAGLSATLFGVAFVFTMMTPPR